MQSRTSWNPKCKALRAVRILAGFVAAVCSTAGAHATEQWEFRFLMSDRGLHFPEVNDILEDNAGQIWAASWGGGLACISEDTWTTYTELNGLANNWVRGLTLGADGTVWISTPGGLCYVAGGELHCLAPDAVPVLAGDEPNQIHAGRNGDLLISTFAGGLIRAPGVSSKASLLWEDPGRAEVLITRGESRGVRVGDMEDDAGGRVAVSFEDGSWGHVEGGVFTRQPNIGGELCFATRPGEDGAPELWAATSHSMEFLEMKAGQWAHVHGAPAKLRCLASGPDGYYAGSTAGLYRADAAGVFPVDLGRLVGFPDINAVFFASDGSLWLGTREGLVRGAPHAWKSYRSTSTGHRIVGLVRDPADAGSLIAIDEQHGVARLQDDAWIPFTRLEAPETLFGHRTFANQPYLWALGAGDIYQFNLADGRFVASHPLPPQTNVNQQLFMTSSGELWLGVNEGVVALIDGAWVPRPERPDYMRRSVNTFAEPSPGVIYLGVRDGIERWQADEITYFGSAHGVAEDDAVYTICPTRGGDIWFGTYGSGAYVYNGETFQRFDHKTGLAHHSVADILEGTDGTIWLAYRRVGIASFRDDRWLNFGYENGLTNSPIVRLLEDGSGTLWLLSQNEGVIRYRPDTQAPETRITAATAEVPHGGIGVFSFKATDAWQRTPEHALLYSWRVMDEANGAELAPWNAFVPETTFISAGFAPGAYRLEVRASDDARNVDATPAAVSFVVAVPFWRHPQFLLISGMLLLVCTIALFMRMRAHQALRQSEGALILSNQQLMSEIKERIQAEQRLNDHFEQLEVLVKGRTAELEAAQRALMEQERLATLGKVTASVSHELRNPLGTLRSTLFLIARKVQGHNLGLEDALARAERSIQRCDRIIEEFLDITRAVAMEREMTCMDTWLRGVLEEMQFPPALHREFTFSSGIVMEVDPERLRRAVVNVVNNAVQAMSEYGGEFKRLRVKSRVRAGRYEIVVKDNGPGISEANLSRIFEPLYSTKGFGVGLGVPIVKGIMVKHQGGVEYHSVVGKGTTVVLWIPGDGALKAQHILEDEAEAAGEDHHPDHETDDEEYDSKDVKQADAGETEIVGLREPQNRQEDSEE